MARVGVVAALFGILTFFSAIFPSPCSSKSSSFFSSLFPLFTKYSPRPCHQQQIRPITGTTRQQQVHNTDETISFPSNFLRLLTTSVINTAVQRSNAPPTSSLSAVEFIPGPYLNDYGIYENIQNIPPDTWFGTTRAPPVPSQGIYRGNLTSWIYWLHYQLTTNCKHPGELDYRKTHYMQYKIPYEELPADVFSTTAGSRGDSLRRLLKNEIQTSDYVLKYWWPYLLGLTFPGLLLMFITCASCLCFDKGCRRRMSYVCFGMFFRDRERVSLHRISAKRRIVVGGMLALLGVVGVIVFAAVAIYYSRQVMTGVEHMECSLWRGWYEAAFGDAYTGASPQKLNYLSWAQDEQASYRNGTSRGWMGFAAVVDFAEYVTTSLGSSNDSLQNVADRKYAEMRTKLTAESSRAVQKLSLIESGLATAAIIASLHQHRYQYLAYEASVRTAKQQIADIMTNKMDRLSFIIRDSFGDRSYFPGYHRASSDFEDSIRNGVKSFCPYIDSAVTYQSEMDSILYVLENSLIAFSLLALLAALPLLIVLVYLGITIRRKTKPAATVISMTACSWIGFSCYAASAMLLSGICFAVLAFVSEGCNFLQIDLMRNGDFKNYKFIADSNVKFTAVMEQCMVVGAPGSFLTAMNYSGTVSVLKDSIALASDDFSDSLKDLTSLNLTEMTYFQGSNCSALSWLYLPDTDSATASGHGDKIDPLPVTVWMSGLQPYDVARLPHPQWPYSYRTVYGLQTIVQTIREMTRGTNRTNWCMAHQPTSELGSCDPLQSTTTGGMSITAETNAVLPSPDRSLLETYNELQTNNSSMHAVEFLNAVWWAAQKESMLSSPTFPCMDGTNRCLYSQFSPYVVANNFTNSRVCAATGPAVAESNKFNKALDDETNDMHTVVSKKMALLVSYLNKLMDGTACDVWWKNIDLISSNICQLTFSAVAFLVMCWSVLGALSIIATILGFKLWHYLYDIHRSMERLAILAKERGLGDRHVEELDKLEGGEEYATDNQFVHLMENRNKTSDLELLPSHSVLSKGLLHEQKEEDAQQLDGGGTSSSAIRARTSPKVKSGAVLLHSCTPTNRRKLVSFAIPASSSTSFGVLTGAATNNAASNNAASNNAATNNAATNNAAAAFAD